jgi:hypothetical protein
MHQHRSGRIITEKKVWTVNAKDVEHIQCEHVNKPGYIVQLEAQIQELEKDNEKLDELKEKLSKERDRRKFNLEPEKFSPEVNMKHFRTSLKKQPMRCKMTQIPANSNDGTTGHKLQGMSKDVIIVTSWPTGGLSKIFKNWEYVVLLRVRTLCTKKRTKQELVYPTYIRKDSVQT